MTALARAEKRHQCALARVSTIAQLQASAEASDPTAAHAALERHRARGTTTRLSHSKASSNDWFRIFPNARFPELFRALYRVLRDDRHLYVMCDHETLWYVRPAGEAAGFKFAKPLIWDKVTIGMGYHYRCRYECIAFFEKGRRRLASLSIADVLSVARVRHGWPTEKPVHLLKTLVFQSTKPDELVIDPFCGSGSAGEASLHLGRSFAGADINPGACAVSRGRLAPLGKEGGLKVQLPLWPSPVPTEEAAS